EVAAHHAGYTRRRSGGLNKAELGRVSRGIAGPNGLRVARVRHGWWPFELWQQPYRRVPTTWCLCWSHSQRHQACRFACSPADQVRVGHQSKNRSEARHQYLRQSTLARRRGDRVRRREFITLVGGAAAAWPLAARAQQARMPVVGLLLAGSREPLRQQIAAINAGLKETGYVEGLNISVEYRFAEGQFERFPALAAELVGRPVAVLVTSSNAG